METRDFLDGAAPGRLEEQKVDAAYLEMAAAHIDLGSRRFKVVVDAGNGTGGLAAPLLSGLGFDVTELYCEPDGRFPHHHPDPTVEANLADLAAKVAEVGAELGVALDGDADRIGVVDAGGRVLWGDQLMILFARSILREVPGAVFVGEVKCSSALYDEIARAGGRAIMWKAGHSLIKDKMKQEGALLGGELSGHIFFQHRYYGFDDAIYAAARLVELLSKSELTLAQQIDTLPPLFNTPELRLPRPEHVDLDEKVRQIVALVRETQQVQVIEVDGARIVWPEAAGGGWALVRASSTQSALVLRFEAATAARLAQLRSLVDEALQLTEEPEKERSR